MMIMTTKNDEIELAIKIMSEGIDEIRTVSRREQTSCSSENFLFLDDCIERAEDRLKILSALLRNGEITVAAAIKLFAQRL
jgi:hypothetical protein